MGINFHGGGTDRLSEQPLPGSVTLIDVFFFFSFYRSSAVNAPKKKNFSAALIDVLSAPVTAPL